MVPKRKMRSEASPAPSGMKGFLRRAAVGIATPAQPGLWGGLQAGLAGSLGQGQAEQAAQAQMVQQQLENDLKQRQVAAEEMRAQRDSVPSNVGELKYLMDTLGIPQPDALNRVYPPHQGATPAQQFGTDTGVAPMGFLGPLPPGQIHQEELPSGIGPSDYPVYRKARAAQLGSQSVPRQYAPKAESQWHATARAISAERGISIEQALAQMASGQIKVRKNVTHTVQTYAPDGSLVTDTVYGYEMPNVPAGGGVGAVPTHRKAPAWAGYVKQGAK